MKARERSLIFLFLVIDLLLLNASLAIIAGIKYGSLVNINYTFHILNISWFIVYLFFINRKLFERKNFYKRVLYVITQFTYYISLSSFLIVILNLDDLSRAMFLGSTIIFFVFKVIISFPYAYLIQRRKKGQYYRKILVVGAGEIGESIRSYYQRNSDFGEIVGFLDDEKVNSNKFNILGKLSDFQEVFNKLSFNEVIITLHLTDNIHIKEIINIAEYNGVRPRVVPNYYSMFNRKYEVKSLDNIPIVNIREVSLEQYSNRFWKRAFDIVFASLVLLLLSPLLLIIVIAIKLESKGPVFYKPVRVGIRGDKFTVYKFRSMKANDDSLTGTKSTQFNDPRVTKVGKYLRRTNLDEIPQFINVILNEMSVVGPRPHRLYLNKEFQENVSTYMVRHYIKPGITGWAQVNGWRGPCETKLQFKARALYDLWYVEHWNFGLDFYIIYLTLFSKKSYLKSF